MRKKKFRFSIHLDLLDLSSVPYVNGSFFTKLRLVEGGDFAVVSSRAAVSNHRVTWEKSFTLTCKMYAPITTGILEECCLRLSVRKDGKGGKIEKLGFVDLNLAEHAGAGETEKRFILHRYTSEHRVDNSILRLKFNVSLKEGDPLFKRPAVLVAGDTSHPESRHSSSMNGAATPVFLAEDASMVGGEALSLTSTVLSPPLHGGAASLAEIEDVVGSAGNLSVEPPVPSVSTLSPLRPVSSLELPASHGTLPRTRARTGRWMNTAAHRRNVSWDSARLNDIVRDTSFTPEPGNDCLVPGLLGQGQARICSTRVDASGIVNEVMNSVAATEESPLGGDGTSGLRLVVRKDGTAMVSGRKVDRHSARSLLVEGK